MFSAQNTRKWPMSAALHWKRSTCGSVSPFVLNKLYHPMILWEKCSCGEKGRKSHVLMGSRCVSQCLLWSSENPSAFVHPYRLHLWLFGFSRAEFSSDGLGNNHPFSSVLQTLTLMVCTGVECWRNHNRHYFISRDSALQGSASSPQK